MHDLRATKEPMGTLISEDTSIGSERPGDVPVRQFAPPAVLPLRVALLTNFIPPYFLPVLKALSKQVAELHLFVSTEMEDNRDWSHNWGELNVKLQKTVTLLCKRKHHLGFSSKYYLHFPYDTVLRLLKCQPDVVISAQLGLRTIQASLFRALRPRTGLVSWADLSEHTELGIGSAKQMLRRSLLRYSDAVLVNGESGARYVIGLNAPAGRVVRMPYVRDLKDLSVIPLSRGDSASRRLLYVGQLLEGKGLHLLLDALGRRQRLHPGESCELLIAGDGPKREELEHTAKSNLLNVRFLGSIPFCQLCTIYASAGIFVFPTLSDTWGVVVNEALAAGLPVLGSGFSQAVCELIRDGYNGWKLRPDRPQEFDAALEQALGSPTEILDEMRGAARSSVSGLTPEYAAERICTAVRLAHETAMVRVGAER